MRHFQKIQAGFTIVELLIVIVVIGILAAITIVSYNGVVARSARVADISMLNSYMMGLQQLAATNDLPFANACLGPPSSYSAADPTKNCLEGGQYATASDSAALNAKLNAIGVKDQVFKQPVAVTPQFIYHYAGTQYSVIGYNMTANSDCGFGGVLSRQGNNGSQSATGPWGLWGDKITFVNDQPDKAVFCLVTLPF